MKRELLTLRVGGREMAKVTKNKRARQTREVKRAVKRSSVNGRKKLAGSFL
jgi:hypothetical protein